MINELVLKSEKPVISSSINANRDRPSLFIYMGYLYQISAKFENREIYNSWFYYRNI